MPRVRPCHQTVVFMMILVDIGSNSSASTSGSICSTATAPPPPAQLLTASLLPAASDGVYTVVSIDRALVPTKTA